MGRGCRRVTTPAHGEPAPRADARGGARDAAAVGDVRPAASHEAADAVDILREASQWTARFGAPIWAAESFTVPAYRAYAEVGELVGAFDVGPEGERMVACMLLQHCDPVYWPDDPPGAAIYLHKVAVRRAAAGRGWPGRLVDHALEYARHAHVGAVRLDTLPSGRLPALYASLGFRPADAGPRWIDGRWVLRMEHLL